MRASPAPKDTIDLLITASWKAGIEEISPTTDELDRLGQLLWDENHSAVGFSIGWCIAAPRYSWQPVAELLGSRWHDEQVLQIEHSRLYLEEISCHHPGWDTSEARSLLAGLGRAIEQRMAGYPLAPSPAHAGVVEYAGLSRLPEEWTRDLGWRVNLTAEAAATAHPGRLT